MDNVSLRLINNRKGKGSPKVASSVELRITYQRKNKYISTGIKVTTSQWKDGKVIKHPDAFVLNERLAEFYANASRVIRNMEDEGFIDLQAIPERMARRGTTKTFWAYVEERAEERTGVTEDTRKHYYSFLHKIKEYNLFKTFTDINERNVNKFDEMLHADKEGYKQPTIYGYHKNMKLFISDAKMDGYLKDNVYELRKIKIDKGDARIDKYLTAEEVDKIRKAPVVGKLVKVRDLFVFACYTGLSYKDLVTFNREDITERGGIKMIIGERGKTKVEYIIVLLKPALEILEKYNYQLPVISNQKYNDYLKDIAMVANIDKPLTTHWARHTSAMMMLNNNVPIEIVAKVLGHASIRTTQTTYARIQREAVEREMTAFEKRVL